MSAAEQYIGDIIDTEVTAPLAEGALKTLRQDYETAKADAVVAAERLKRLQEKDAKSKQTSVDIVKSDL